LRKDSKEEKRFEQIAPQYTSASRYFNSSQQPGSTGVENIYTGITGRKTVGLNLQIKAISFEFY